MTRKEMKLKEKMTVWDVAKKYKCFTNMNEFEGIVVDLGHLGLSEANRLIDDLKELGYIMVRFGISLTVYTKEQDAFYNNLYEKEKSRNYYFDKAFGKYFKTKSFWFHSGLVFLIAILAGWLLSYIPTHPNLQLIFGILVFILMIIIWQNMFKKIEQLAYELYLLDHPEEVEVIIDE